MTTPILTGWGTYGGELPNGAAHTTPNMTCLSDSRLTRITKWTDTEGPTLTLPRAPGGEPLSGVLGLGERGGSLGLRVSHYLTSPVLVSLSCRAPWGPLSKGFCPSRE